MTRCVSVPVAFHKNLNKRMTGPHLTPDMIRQQLYRLINDSDTPAEELDLYLRHHPPIALNQLLPYSLYTPVSLCISQGKVDKLKVIVNIIREDRPKRLSMTVDGFFNKDNLGDILRHGTQEMFDFVFNCPEVVKFIDGRPRDSPPGEQTCLLKESYTFYSRPEISVVNRRKRSLLLMKKGAPIMKFRVYQDLHYELGRKAMYWFLDDLKCCRLFIALMQSHLPRNKANRLGRMIPEDVFRKLKGFLFRSW